MTGRDLNRTLRRLYANADPDKLRYRLLHLRRVVIPNERDPGILARQYSEAGIIRAQLKVAGRPAE